jgi:PRC-barrel domain
MTTSTTGTGSGGVATDETEHLISSSKVEGTAVYDRQGERLGTVSSFMVDKFTGQVAYAVMSFGGFLGMGQSCHPLPWKALTYDTGKGGYVVDLDKETLKAGPSYAAGQSPTWNQGYGASVDAYYDRPDRPRHETAIDVAVEDSFPASDPPAWTSETGAGKPRER